MSDMIKVTWEGGPEDGRTFTMNKKQAPYIMTTEYALLRLNYTDPGVSEDDVFRTRLVPIDKKFEEFYDVDGVFEYTKMWYVASYNKGVIR